MINCVCIQNYKQSFYGFHKTIQKNHNTNEIKLHHLNMQDDAIALFSIKNTPKIILEKKNVEPKIKIIRLIAFKGK